MILEKQGYAYNDLTIVPATISRINSRSEVNPFIYGNTLPLFTAPMSTVADTENFNKWEENGITPIMPRNIDIEERKQTLLQGKWVAFSLKETEELLLSNNRIESSHIIRICIDIANGHMKKLMLMCRNLRNRYKDHIEIMAGNVAAPSTIIEYEKYGIDYVRLSIGSGASCTTAPQTGVHYPIASLINDCREIKEQFKLKIKLIADGGIRNYGDVIKALALGADCVMIGSLFAGFYESAAETGMTQPELEQQILRMTDSFLLDEETIREYLKKYVLEKEFYGMSTKKAQRLIKPDAEIKTAEGTFKKIRVKYTMKQWVENMEAYLRSAMSYCDAETLEDFIGKQTLIPNSPAEINAVNK